MSLNEKIDKDAQELLDLENDPAFIQKLVGDDCSANKINSSNINLSSFTLNRNKKR
jgi:hypothetical protein